MLLVQWLLKRENLIYKSHTIDYASSNCCWRHGFMLFPCVIGHRLRWLYNILHLCGSSGDNRGYRLWNKIRICMSKNMLVYIVRLVAIYYDN